MWLPVDYVDFEWCVCWIQANAPNFGVAKNLINLNGPLALFAGYFLGQKLTKNMLIGSFLTVVGAYISTLE